MSFSWIVFALLSAVFAALVAIFGKMGLSAADTTVSTTARAIIMAVFLIFLLFVQGKADEIKTLFSDHRAAAFIILSGIAGALSWLFYFAALKNGKVSQVVSIDRLSVVFAIVMAFLMLGEKISLKTGLGAALIAIGGILAALG